MYHTRTLFLFYCLQRFKFASTLLPLTLFLKIVWDNKGKSGIIKESKTHNNNNKTIASTQKEKYIV